MNTTPTTENRSPSLSTVYRDWKHTQSLLKTVEARAVELTPDQVAIVLENAVMHRLLITSEPSVPELFLAVDFEAISHGFDAIGRPVDKSLVDVILDVLQSPWPQDNPTEEPAVHLTETELICGDFRQPLVTPVRRLLDVAHSQYEAGQALHHVARCWLRYASIYAKTRHIGPPQGVYEDFYAWGVRNEGFASPFNARLLGKPEGKFFSAFADTDGVFGSHGSLFRAEHTDHTGAWCLDPPFLPKTMERTVDTIRRWRADSDCPAILLIVPTSFKPDYEPDETVRLKAGHHCYTGLDGVLSPLPVDVSIHRYGQLEGFSAERIQEGYSPQ